MAKNILALVLCLSFAGAVFAAASPSPKATASQPQAKPDWSELTPAQRNILAPLMEDWQEIDTVRRKKWIKIADSYPNLKPEQQQRLQTRMKDWAKLTPEQRRVAREKYNSIKKLPPAQRDEVKAQWEQYQQSRTPKSDPSGQYLPGNP
jgi:hypothetical protein